MALDRDRIRREGVKLLDEFSSMLANVKETRETHYVVDMKNITREDGEPRECAGFREKIKRNAPLWEGNSFIAEKGS